MATVDHSGFNHNTLSGHTLVFILMQVTAIYGSPKPQSIEISAFIMSHHYCGLTSVGVNWFLFHPSWHWSVSPVSHAFCWSKIGHPFCFSGWSGGGTVLWPQTECLMMLSALHYSNGSMSAYNAGNYYPACAHAWIPICLVSPHRVESRSAFSRANPHATADCHQEPYGKKSDWSIDGWLPHAFWWASSSLLSSHASPFCRLSAMMSLQPFLTKTGLTWCLSNRPAAWSTIEMASCWQKMCRIQPRYRSW